MKKIQILRVMIENCLEVSIHSCQIPRNQSYLEYPNGFKNGKNILKSAISFLKKVRKYNIQIV